MTFTLMSAANSTSSAAPAWFALLGVGVTALVGLVGLVVKHGWDVEADERRQTHQAQEQRWQWQRGERRAVYARYLAALNDLEEALLAYGRLTVPGRGDPGDIPAEVHERLERAFSLAWTLRMEIDLVASLDVQRTAHAAYGYFIDCHELAQSSGGRIKNTLGYLLRELVNSMRSDLEAGGSWYREEEDGSDTDESG